MKEENKSHGEVRWGCFWYPDFQQSLELFFCFNRNNPSSPALFHWAGAPDKTVNWVQSITKPTTLQFKKNGSRKLINRRLQSLLSWTQKWPDSSFFSPSVHCTISHHQIKDYKLICTNPNPNYAKTENNKWTRIISGGLVVVPSVNL